VQSGRGIGIETKLLDLPQEEVLLGVFVSCYLSGPSRSPCQKGTVLNGCRRSYQSSNATLSGHVVVLILLPLLTRSKMGWMN
jgi:hypothetical protein